MTAPPSTKRAKRAPPSHSPSATSASGDTPSASGGDDSDASDGSASLSPSRTPPPSSSDEDGGGGTKAVSVSFEFFDPKAGDYHALRALLASWLDGAPFDVSGLTSAVVAQTRVGTVLKAGNDDAGGGGGGGDAASAPAIGVVTCLNAGRADLAPAFGALAALVAAAPGVSKADAATAKALLSSARTGVIVSERVANTPPALAPPLAAALFDEVAWATEDEPTVEERDAFKVDCYAVWSRAFVGGGGARGTAAKAGDAPPPASSSSSPPSIPVPPPEDHAHPEAGFLCGVADWSVVVPAPSRAPGRAGDPTPVRVLARVPAGRVGEARAALEAALGKV